MKNFLDKNYELLVSLILGLLVALLMASCGTNEGGNNADSTKEEVVTNSDSPMSFYVEKVKQLKKCDDSLNNALAYVKDTNEVYGCDGKEWVLVDLKGEDGEDGKVLTAQEEKTWIDPITSRTWKLIGTKATTPYDTNNNHICTNHGMSVPELLDIEAAVTNGMWIYFSEVADGDFILAYARYPTTNIFKVYSLDTGSPNHNGYYGVGQQTYNGSASVYCYK